MKLGHKRAPLGPNQWSDPVINRRHGGDILRMRAGDLFWNRIGGPAGPSAGVRSRAANRQPLNVIPSSGVSLVNAFDTFHREPMILAVAGRRALDLRHLASAKNAEQQSQQDRSHHRPPQ
jgi:hypothetical protein